jgi:hypothetical protein
MANETTTKKLRISRAFNPPPDEAKPIPGHMNVLLILIDAERVGINRGKGETEKGHIPPPADSILEYSMGTIELGYLPLHLLPNGQPWVPSTGDLNETGQSIVRAITQSYDDMPHPLPMALVLEFIPARRTLFEGRAFRDMPQVVH